MSGRRGLAAAVVGIAVGAGLVLLGASRVWWLQTVAQPAPLRPQEIVHTGASLAPVLPALGWVALAGAGGLIATRGSFRRLVGGLLVAAAVGVVALVIPVLSSGNPVGLGWPAACLSGAVIVGAAGVLTAREGDRWPVMGRRYGYGSPGTGPATGPAAPSGAVSGKDQAGRMPDSASQTVESAEWWDAVDRGEDPTRA